jgi:hypothetical protein
MSLQTRTVPVAADIPGLAWACFFIGVALLLVGAALGTYLALTTKKAQADARTKVDDAKATVESALQSTRDVIAEHTSVQLAALDSPQAAIAAVSASSTQAQQAASDAETSLTSALTQLDEVKELLAALPEPLRWPGLLVLVGAALISVATIQQGGVSLF